MANDRIFAQERAINDVQCYYHCTQNYYILLFLETFIKVYDVTTIRATSQSTFIFL